MIKYIIATTALCDSKITLLDIWNNRQFTAFKLYCMQLRQVMEKEFIIEPDKICFLRVD